MRVAIDISPIRGAHQFRGIGIYTKLLVKSLQKYDPENEYILTTKSSQARVDLIHYPFFDFFFLTMPFFRFKPTVVTIHDVIPLLYPKYYPSGIKGGLKMRLQRYKLKSVKAVITDSDCSKTDIVKTLNLASDKVNRVYLAADPDLKQQGYNEQSAFRKKYGITKPYFLYVGDINYNKNLSLLINAFAVFAKDFDLVLISRALNKDIPEAIAIQDQITSLKLKTQVKTITDLSDDINLKGAVYSGAFWYIQPSLYEGFGLPVLEAMQCHTPVIASSGGSLPEVLGKAGLSFNPLSQNDLIEKMSTIRVMTKRQRQVYVNSGIVQAQSFSWEKTARETIEVYKQVLGL